MSDDGSVREDGAAEWQPDGRIRGARRQIAMIAVVLLLCELNAMAVAMLVPGLRPMAAEFPVEGLAWTITVVSLVGAMAMPLGGKLVDRFGQRPVVLTACAVFLLGSLISALSSSFALMIVGRALQGTIAVMPVIAYRVFRDSLPPRIVPIALGALGTGFGVSGLLAPIIGGALVDGLGYRSIFWFFVVYTAVLTPLSVVVLPRTPRRRSTEVGRIDVLGGLLLAAGIGGILLGLGEGGKWGWLAPSTLLVLLGGIIALGLFVLVESRVEEPMIELRLLRNPAVALTLTVGLVGFMSCGMMAITLPQMLQTPSSTGMVYAFGLSALMVGLAQIPFGITSMVFGPVGGALTKRFNPRAIMISSLVSFAIGSMLLAMAHRSLVLILVWLCFMGVGFGLFWAAQPNLMVEAVPAKYTGVSGGIQVCSVSISTAIGSAVVGAVLGANVADVGPDGPLYNDSAFTTIFLVGTGTAVIALVITLFMQHGRQPATGGAATDLELGVESVHEDVGSENEPDPTPDAPIRGVPA